MRVGLSWDLDHGSGAEGAWKTVLAEIEQADQLGYDSVWFGEGRAAAADCSSPTLFLTYAARKTKNLQLRSAARQVTRANPVRIAEEVAVLDIFSRGRAGIAFAAAGPQGAPTGQVHETIDFVDWAWAADDFRYCGEYVRFPTHTGDDAPPGASVPAAKADYLPQWERGPVMPDYLAVTPKPYVPRPPLYVEIHEDETLEWAAGRGIAPVVGADLSTAEAVERLTRYRSIADSAGRSRAEVDAVLERRVALDGAGDEHTLGGGTADLLNRIRELRAETSISHFVWRRNGSSPGDLYRFSGEVQMLLQA